MKTKWHRGSCLKDNEIQDFKDCAGKKKENGYPYEINLFGFTSTTFDESAALGFAKEDEAAGIKKVLYVFKWANSEFYYFLDNGAYPSEYEVLLFEGLKFKVESVEEKKDSNGKVILTTITLEKFP